MRRLYSSCDESVSTIVRRMFSSEIDRRHTLEMYAHLSTYCAYSWRSDQRRAQTSP